MKSFLKTYRTYFISFIIPVVIMSGVYLSQGIYWNSDNSLKIWIDWSVNLF